MAARAAERAIRQARGLYTNTRRPSYLDNLEGATPGAENYPKLSKKVKANVSETKDLIDDGDDDIADETACLLPENTEQ